MKVLIQAGHQGRTSGAVGAPGEQKWSGEIVPKIAQRLRERGMEVKEVNADPSNSEIAGNWDLFLTVHYDADMYDSRGGFIDTPDPSVDFATEESNRIAEEMRKVYFDATGIPEHQERSNANTRYYYMWERMSASTPCVILEAGVGFRTKEDHDTLHFKQNKVSRAVADGIINALIPNTEPPVPPTDPCKKYKDQIIVLKKQLEITKDKNTELSNEIRDHECPITPPSEPSMDEKTVKETIELIKTVRTYAKKYLV